jgi:hypothetical protein
MKKSTVILTMLFKETLTLMLAGKGGSGSRALTCWQRILPRAAACSTCSVPRTSNPSPSSSFLLSSRRHWASTAA